ncbi:MAG TPA: hypothetical protein VFQ88_12305 [Nevskiaceae bacterium]|nr:hypothetical protein [Nevskiaceae bacterium]
MTRLVVLFAAALAAFPLGVCAQATPPRVHETPFVPVPAPKPLPLTVPRHGVYAQPMATITGTGAVKFHITLGMLVTKTGRAVGLYRSYPSRTRRNLSEQYGLGMLQTRAGVILSSDGTLPILTLHGAIGGGPTPTELTLTYLTNGVTRHYATQVLLIRQFGARWAFVSANGKPICGFTVRSGRVGVQSVLSTLCSAR